MKHRIMELLACPECGQDLSLEPGAVIERLSLPNNFTAAPGCRDFCARFSESIRPGGPRPPADCLECYSQEIIDGGLACAAGHRLRINDGVPQLVGESPAGKSGRTSRAFGYEWTRYRVDLAEEERSILLEETMSEPGEYSGRLVLDAGCGMGRFTRAAAGMGAEVVGIDLSPALKSAYELSRGYPLLHFIQGDLLKPPLKPDAFDFIYSLGVLHHTPDTRRALAAIVPLAKKGGTVAFWVYGRAGKYQNFKSNPLEPVRADFFERRPYLHRPYWIGLKIREMVSDALRTVTVRLPLPLLYRLCLLPVPLGAVPLFKYFTFSAHPDWRVRLQENFDWLSPPYQFKHTKEEVRAWIAELGLAEEDMLSHGLVPKIGFRCRRA